MKISIITAVYNNRDEIEIAINSVLSQTYKNIEYIIVDGGSTDGTVEIINRHIDKISRFISEPDKGIYDALNKGLSIASGDIIGLLHSDDIFASNMVIEKIAETFIQGNYDAVYGDLEYVSKTDTSKVIRYWKSSQFDAANFYEGWMPPHPTLFMKKKIYEEYGNFDTSYKIASDYDLMLRTLASGKIEAKYIPIVITRMRLGGTSNKNLKNIWRKSFEDWQALRRNNIGGFLILLKKNLTKIGQFIIKKNQEPRTKSQE